MANITFVYPDFESIGIEYLMALCLKDGHKVSLIYYHAEDITWGRKKKEIDFESISKKIAATQPQIVAFSCVTDNYQSQLSCARTIKKNAPHIVTVFGGCHPTAVPETVLREPAIDCVAIGEAEKSFPLFLRECDLERRRTLPDKPIKGIVYKRGGTLIGEFEEGELIDLNRLPFPHKNPFYSTLKAFSYEYRIITSRGCPYSCSYCFNTFYHTLRVRHTFRQRTVDNVIAELLWAKKNYAPKYVLFLDDCFITNDKWISEFCKRYKKEINLPFGCITIPHYLNREKVDALSSSGCVSIQIGVQSLDKDLCTKTLNRKSNNLKTAEAISILKDAGIIVQVDHMLGIPGDTLTIQEESILFYNECKPNLISIFWLTYYPKTPIIEIAKRRRILTENDINKRNEGLRLNEDASFTRGSKKDLEFYNGIPFLLTYTPFLPKWLVRFLVNHRLYNTFSTKNFFASTLFPRMWYSVLNRKDFRGRSKMIHFFYNRLKLILDNFRTSSPS